MEDNRAFEDLKSLGMIKVMETVAPTNGTRKLSLEERLKVVEKENKVLRANNMILRELLWDWGINFEEKMVH